MKLSYFPSLLFVPVVALMLLPHLNSISQDQSDADETTVLASDTPLIDSLAGITLFSDDPEKRNSQPAQFTEGIKLIGLETPRGELLSATLKSKFLGKSLTFETLDLLVKEITQHYVDQGRPTTQVFVPEQEITDKIKIAVLEGRLGEIQFDNSEKSTRRHLSSNSHVMDKLRSQQGQILDMNVINSAVVDMNESPWARLGREVPHPYRTATAALTPGSYVGLTDVELNVHSRDIVPIQVFSSWDNTGTALLGEDRFTTGMVWYDAFDTGADHLFGLQMQSAGDYDAFHGVTASYQIPIPGLDSKIQFFGAYLESSLDLPARGVRQNVDGNATILGGRYYFDLPTRVLSDNSEGGGYSRKQSALYHEVGFGFDYKAQTNDLFFGGVNVFPTQIDVVQFVAEYNLRQTDQWGESNASLGYYFSPGGITSNNSDANFLTARSGGAADYSYFKSSLSRLVDLGELNPHLYDMKFVVNGTFQLSSANLVASEQLGLGGQDTIRGYPERAMRGDHGVFIQTELYSPAYHPLRGLAKKTPDRWVDAQNRTDELRFLAFYDYGTVGVRNPTAAEPGTGLNASSIGAGFRYRFNKSMILRFDYGLQLDKLNPAIVNAADLNPKYSNGGDGYAHMGLSVSF